MEIRIGAGRRAAVVKIEKNMWEERKGEISLKRKKKTGEGSAKKNGFREWLHLLFLAGKP